MPARPRLVSPRWREMLASSLEAAEGGVATFYAIRPREWGLRFRYDVASAMDHPALSFRRGTLAQIVQIALPESPRPARWRIVLEDGEIFRLGVRLGLGAVLSYALAHELVHLVRFASGLAHFEIAEEHNRREEEARVRRIAREALLPVLGDEARKSLDVLARGGPA